VTRHPRRPARHRPPGRLWPPFPPHAAAPAAGLRRRPTRARPLLPTARPLPLPWARDAARATGAALAAGLYPVSRCHPRLQPRLPPPPPLLPFAVHFPSDAAPVAVLLTRIGPSLSSSVGGGNPSAGSRAVRGGWRVPSVSSGGCRLSGVGRAARSGN